MASTPPTVPPAMAAMGVVSLSLVVEMAVVLLELAVADVEVMVADVSVVAPPVA